MLQRGVGISALVCTFNRPASVLRVVGSLLANDHSSFEVIVVDQTEGDATIRGLIGYRGDPRLRYLRAPVQSKGTALNIGIAAARSEFIACTDDDCVVPDNWLASVAQVFANHSQAAIIFGEVIAVPYDAEAGFVPAHRPLREGFVDPRFVKAPDGMGACMAVRRSAIRALGGFDPAIGPGATFGSGDDRDIAIRALFAGHGVFETRSIHVVHHGFRTTAEGRQHARSAWYGMGAIAAKLVKHCRWRVLWFVADVFVVRAVLPALTDAVRLRRPRGLNRIAAFVIGFARGLRAPTGGESPIFRLRR